MRYLILFVLLVFLCGCGSEAPTPPTAASPDVTTAEPAPSTEPEATTPPAATAAAGGSSILGFWGIKEEGIKAMIEAMKAEAVIPKRPRWALQ